MVLALGMPALMTLGVAMGAGAAGSVVMLLPLLFLLSGLVGRRHGRDRDD